MDTIASQITGISAVCLNADQIKHQSSTSLASVRGIHRWPVNSPHDGPVMRKMLPFDDVIMIHKKYPTACPSEKDMGCLLWDQNQIYNLVFSFLGFMQYHFVFGLVITRPDHIRYVKHWWKHALRYIDGIEQWRCNSIANALELCLSCTNPSIWILLEFLQTCVACEYKCLW